jgi:O-antigen/teichoic acid export membrane protein
MVRALGAREFGVFVYVTAVIAVLESFVDLGVSAAAGKAIATARDAENARPASVVRDWFGLQALVAAVGFAPVMGLTYAVAISDTALGVSFDIVLVLVVAACIGVFLNFARAALTSLLAFKALAALDTTEALVRGAGWIAVAVYMPTAVGLAWASLLTAAVMVILAGAFAFRLYGFSKVSSTPERSAGRIAALRRAYKHMLRASLGFLWLRLMWRVIQSVPMVVFGRMFGTEIVGILGVFSKLIEWIGFPFIVIGTALAVRAPGVVARGHSAVRELWDAASKFIAVSLMLAASVGLASGLLAELFLPKSVTAPHFIALLSPLIFVTVAAAVVAPMSDYVGSLRLRNLLLTGIAIVQLPILLVAGWWLGPVGAVAAHVAIGCAMTFGYVAIARHLFFGSTRYRVRVEVWYFVAIATLGFLLASVLRAAMDIEHWTEMRSIALIAMDITVFWATVLLALVLHPRAKKFFLTRHFFAISAF